MESESDSSITQYRMVQTNRNNPRSLLFEAIPILRTNAGKFFLIIGLGCVLVVIFGVGFILYTVSYNLRFLKMTKRLKCSVMLLSKIM